MPRVNTTPSLLRRAATPNPSLERDLHRHGTWPAKRSLLIIRFAGQAPSRFRPLSSNVRQHHVALKVLAIASGAAVAAKCQMPSSATVVQARRSKSGNAQVPRSALLPSLVRLQRFAATTLFRSLRWYQSVRGSAATRKVLPSFTTGGGCGLERRRQLAALAHQRPVGKGNACVLHHLVPALSATSSAA